MDVDLPGGGRVVDLLAMTPALLKEHVAERGLDDDPIFMAAMESTLGLRARLKAEIKEKYPGMRITSMQVYTTGAEEFELPDPQPGHWRTLSACDAEGAAEGAAAAPGQPAAAPPAGVVVMQDRTTGMRLLTGMAGHSVTMKPATFEGGETGLSLYPHNSYVLIDMVPRDPSRACSFCAEAGVRLQKCAACRAARYCSKRCQVAYWKRGGHKQQCAELAAAAAAQQGDDQAADQAGDPAAAAQPGDDQATEDHEQGDDQAAEAQQGDQAAAAGEGTSAVPAADEGKSADASG